LPTPVNVTVSLFIQGGSPDSGNYLCM